MDGTQISMTIEVTRFARSVCLSSLTRTTKEVELDLYKPDMLERGKKFKLAEGTALFFLSDSWHRVNPVTSGVRKSLVAWFSGPPYV